MSHIVSITTKVHDPVAVAAACTRLGWPNPCRAPPRFTAGRPPA